VNDTGVRVRFAPSPTGYLHVGGARTALFNWLFARHHRGAFVLRIEDTDVKRFETAFEDAIYEALHWLGLHWDEGPDVGGPHGPYRQSERASRYVEVAHTFVARNAAYECFCGPADERRCPCGSLTEAQRSAARAKEPAPARRMRVDPAKALVVDDLVRGAVTFPPGSLDDFVITKSGGGPLYNFAAAVDDHDMLITHVIRGDEHLANTPKQLLIYEAMGWPPPRFAHIPIILNEAREKLSKRDGAVFLNDYEAAGILPSAMFNFLALLGWSPGDNRELLTRDELIAAFDLDRVVKHPAVFDVSKLRWMNGEYMKRTPASDIAAQLRRLMKAGDGRVDKVAALLKDRVRTLVEIIEQGDYLLSDGPLEPQAEALAKYCSAPDTVELLAQARAALAGVGEFSDAAIEAAIRSTAEEHGKKAAAYIHPLRVALTGRAVSPGIFEVAELIGKDVALRRIDDLMARLQRERASNAKARA
jgi:glutamyl-tRNA synthetase